MIEFSVVNGVATAGRDLPVTIDEPTEAYVMKIEIDPNAPRLHVKVQFRSGKILGRSFHYSEHE